MENAVEALKMAAAVLIFVIALATSFSLFGTAKQTADSIIGMRDKQAYLQSAEFDNGVLYTSASSISGNSLGADKTTEYIAGVTKNGDRVVKADDVIATIYRYYKEKYGVTIVKSDKTVLARFDSNTESIMAQYKDVEESMYETYKSKLEKNTKTDYVQPDFEDLEELYKLDTGGYGAPWYGNDLDIRRRINCDINGGTYSFNGKEYTGKNILNDLKSATKIIEVINEIDNSSYLRDGATETNLLQQYEMPTIEIIYILY